MAPRRASRTLEGLPSLRRGGTVTELLFLYECVTSEPPQLRPIAQSLGLTVQAISHSYRQLARRGLAELKDGRYRATVAGVAWLHRTLSELAGDVGGRLDRLHVIRSCRAIASRPLAAGDRVSLRMKDGRLWAEPGERGASHGRAVAAAAAGALVEIEDLEGIVPIARGEVRILTVPEVEVRANGSAAALGRALAPFEDDLLAASGLEAVHLLERATRRPVVRFGVASAVAEASRIGVPSLVFVLDRDLPRFLAEFEGPDPPPVTVEALDLRRPDLRARPRTDRRKGR